MNQKTNDWLNRHAEQVPSTIPGSDALVWVTKARGDYITMVGMEDDWLSGVIERGITKHLSSPYKAGCTVAIGFNPDEQKWYGWSHRAMYGFGVGSECKKGHCHYRPVDKDDFLDDMIRFWSEEDKINISGEHQDEGVYVEWEYDQTIPNKKMRGKITGIHNRYPAEYGKGEWTATTLAEAREMAIDFANGVS